MNPLTPLNTKYNIVVISIMFIGVINNSINNLLSVRGYHACLYLWEPTIGEVLQAIPEPTNSKHNRAVAVLQDGGMSISRLFQFLRRDVNKHLSGEKVNRGADYGLEIPIIIIIMTYLW